MNVAVNRDGISVAYTVPTIWFFLMMTIALSFLLMYYSYYVVASYIDIITVYLKMPKFSPQMIVPEALQGDRFLF